MLEGYYQKAEERKKLGLPPLPLTPEETGELVQLLEDPPAGHEEELVYLLEQRISPGVDPAARVKASWLEEIALQKRQSPLINPLRAVFLLGTMLGGYNVGPLVSFRFQARKITAKENMKAMVRVGRDTFSFDKFDLQYKWKEVSMKFKIPEDANNFTFSLKMQPGEQIKIDGFVIVIVR